MKHTDKTKNIALRIFEEQIKQKGNEIDALKAELRLFKVTEEISEKAKEIMDYGCKEFSKLKGSKL